MLRLLLFSHHVPLAWIVALAVALILTKPSLAQDKFIKVMQPSSQNQMGERFLVDVVNLAVRKANKTHFVKHRLKFVPLEERQLLSFESYLERGIFDVTYFGTSIALEEKFLPVRIPLFSGLLGYRLSIVKSKNLAMLKNASLEELKQLPVCQGSIWADSDILEHNNFNVVRVSHYEFIVKMLDKDRCLLFPRGLFEGHFEVANLRKQGLNVELMDQILFYYPLPAYLFVKKGNKALADYLEIGLKMAIADGSYQQLLQEHALTRAIFPLEKWRDSRIIELENPYLPKNTPLDRKEYWIKLQNKTVD
ncbi:substrate-binding periplasmic protein [Catenovulum sediminis]|uniref:substrate-binding periplasmic protein n=1 Tax=Catenovulum sediminis TaxID=1740262 RepID=UPI00117FC090|nr:amino acid ABC transporter substrate-binding protein [Catenovulum sediminis]